MSTTYSATSDPDVVEKAETEVEDIDLSEYVNTYLTLEARWQNRPQLKTVPDQETLDVFNEQRMVEKDTEEITIRNLARNLYDVLKPIVDAGLLPAKYLDEFTRLENFVS